MPHWTASEATYYVTFRLGDSLPKDVADQLKLESRAMNQSLAQKLGRALTTEEIKKTQAKARVRLEKLLDAGRGECQLAVPACADIVMGSLLHFDQCRYLLGAWVVMPNHVHALVKPLADYKLEAIVKSWKVHSSLEINKLLGRKGRLWQSEPFDHIVRNHEKFLEFTRYILNNPAAACLPSWKWFGVGSLGNGQEPPSL